MGYEIDEIYLNHDVVQGIRRLFFISEEWDNILVVGTSDKAPEKSFLKRMSMSEDNLRLARKGYAEEKRTAAKIMYDTFFISHRKIEMAGYLATEYLEDITKAPKGVDIHERTRQFINEYARMEKW